MSSDSSPIAPAPSTPAVTPKFEIRFLDWMSTQQGAILDEAYVQTCLSGAEDAPRIALLLDGARFNGALKDTLMQLDGAGADDEELERIRMGIFRAGMHLGLALAEVMVAKGAM